MEGFSWLCITMLAMPRSCQDYGKVLKLLPWFVSLGKQKWKHHLPDEFPAVRCQQPSTFIRSAVLKVWNSFMDFMKLTGPNAFLFLHKGERNTKVYIYCCKSKIKFPVSSFISLLNYLRVRLNVTIANFHFRSVITAINIQVVFGLFWWP